MTADQVSGLARQTVETVQQIRDQLAGVDAELDALAIRMGALADTLAEAERKHGGSEGSQ